MLDDIARKAHDDAGAGATAAEVDGLAPNHIQFVEPFDNYGAFHKTYTVVDGIYSSPTVGFPKLIKAFALPVHDLVSGMEAVKKIAARDGVNERHAAIIWGALRTDVEEVQQALSSSKLRRTGTADGSVEFGNFRQVPRHFYMADFDCNEGADGKPGYDKWCEDQKIDIFADPDGAVRAIVGEFFPAFFKTLSFGYQFSAGAGIKNGKLKPSRAKLHFFIWAENFVTPSTIKALFKAHNAPLKMKYGKDAVDLALFSAVQPNFICVDFKGGKDPLEGKRFGFIKGEVDSVAISYGMGEVRELDFDGNRLETTVQVPGMYVSSGGARTFIPKSSSTGRDYGSWPRDWRGCLARHGEQGSGHDSLKYATLELAKEIAAQGVNLDASAIEPYRVEFNAAINASYRTAQEKAKLRTEITRHFSGAVEWVRSWKMRLNERKQLVKPPTHPDQCVPLRDAQEQAKDYIDGFLDQAKAHAKARAGVSEDLAVFDAEWEAIAARERELDPSWTMPKGRRYDGRFLIGAAPQGILAADVGVGKNHLTYESFLRPGYHDTYRAFLIEPNQDKADDARRDFLKAAKRLGVSTPEPRVFKGLDKLCEAPAAIKALAEEAAKNGLSVAKAVCATCPLAAECEWLKQREDVGPGLKIVQSAHLAAGVPTLGDGPDTLNADNKKGRAPTLMFAIDEEFQGALKKEVLLTPEDLQTAGELPKLMDNKDDEHLLSAAIGHLRSALKTPGPLKRPFFNRLDADAGREYPQKKIDRICSLLGRLGWSMRDEASKKVGEKLKEGGLPPDIPNLARKLRLVSSLMKVFKVIVSSPAHENGDIGAATVLKGNDGVSGLRLSYYDRLPEAVSCAPVLVLDATAHEMITPVPFDLRDEFAGSDIAADIGIERIKVRMDHQYTLKVLDAPVQRGKFAPDVEVVRGAGGKEELVAHKTLRADADWSLLFNVFDGLCGRAEADGGGAGVISYKAVRQYAKAANLLPDAVWGHLGKMRGSNAWEKVSALVVAGRKALFDPKMVEEAAALFALAAPREINGRLVSPVVNRAAGIDHGAEGVLRVAGPDKRSLERGITCRTEVPACPWVRAYYEWSTLGETTQALGRARGAQRTGLTAVLVVDISNTVPDLTYDYVVIWDAFVSGTGLDALMHAKGVVDVWPAHLKSLWPQAFSGASEVKKAAARLFEKWDVTKSVKTALTPYKRTQTCLPTLLLKGIRAVSTDFVTCRPITAHWPLFSDDTVLFGNPAAHPLLTPAQITTARYQPGRTERACLIDQSRRAQASAAQLAAVGVELLPDGGAPEKAPPMTDAERQRKRRAALKAAKEAKAKSTDTKENRHARSTGSNGHQDPAEGAAQAPEQNGSKKPRKAPAQGAGPTARKTRAPKARKSDPRSAVPARTAGAAEGGSDGRPGPGEG